MHEAKPELHYASFGRRFGAMWLDFLFLLPLITLVLWLGSRYRMFELYYLGPGFAITVAYNVYLVKRFGGTPGKLAAGIRIVRVDGSPVGYREALLRHLPTLALEWATSIALILAAMKMSDAEFASLPFLRGSQRFVELAPAWYRPMQVLEYAWIWSEFIVMLTNEKRRALHDFIAGTVVVLRTDRARRVLSR